jgi:hypothetical protein
MEVHDVAPEVFIASVTEKIELCLIYPKNAAVSADPMQWNGGVLEEVVQVSLATSQGFLGELGVIDVERCSEPMLMTIRGSERENAQKDSAIVTLRPAIPRLHAELATLGDGFIPFLPCRLHLLGVNELSPPGRLRVAPGKSGVLLPRLIHVKEAAVGISDP